MADGPVFCLRLHEMSPVRRNQENVSCGGCLLKSKESHLRACVLMNEYLEKSLSKMSKSRCRKFERTFIKFARLMVLYSITSLFVKVSKRSLSQTVIK